MTFAIMEDIIENELSVIDSGSLGLRSDNCSTQYKSRFVFHLMKMIAAKYNIRVTWFHGEAGHGHGLVDAISCFGCKGPLRWAIVTENRWFDTVEEMRDYLRTLSQEGDRKYITIDPVVTANQRRKIRKEHKTEGCQKMHMISVNADGELTTRIFMDSTDENLINLNFDDGEADENINLPPEIENMYGDDVLDEEDNGVVEKDTLFSYPNTFIGLQSPPNSLESFYVVKVLSKGLDEHDISDQFGHTVLAGEQYVSGYYPYLTLFEGKECVKFSLPKKSLPVYIHLKESFSIDIELSSSLPMNINEFHALNQQLY